MIARTFILTILASLEDVLNGLTDYTVLQKIIDSAVIDNELPPDLSERALKNVFDLQTDLELIAEHQDTYAGTPSYLSPERVRSKLARYVGFLRIELGDDNR